MVTGVFCDRKSFRSLATGLEPDFTVYLYDRPGPRPGSPHRHVRGRAGGRRTWPPSAAAGGAASCSGTPPGRRWLSRPPRPGWRCAGWWSTSRRTPADGEPTTGLADELRELATRGTGTTRRPVPRTTGAPPQVIDMITAGPGGRHAGDRASTLVYDITLCNGGAVPMDRLARIPVHTLALAGGAGLGWAVEGAQTIAATIPDAECRIVSGRGHGPTAYFRAVRWKSPGRGRPTKPIGRLALRVMTD